MGFLDSDINQPRPMQYSSPISITPQGRYNSPHVLIAIDLESFLFCDAGKLNVLLVELLFHDLFQCLENQSLGLSQCQRTMIFVL